MAARKRKVTLSDEWKDKIRVSMLMGRLYGHALGEADMSPTQIKAAEVILKKLVPDVARTEVAGDQNAPVKHEFSWAE